MFWMVHEMYDRIKIEKMMDDFETFYNDIVMQEESNKR